METRKNILVVDDEAMIRESVSAYMTKQGYHVFTAEDGKEALEIFQRTLIMFVILDLMLPGMSGEETCQVIRKQSRMPIIMLTAKTQEDIVFGANFEGYDRVIDTHIKNLRKKVETNPKSPVYVKTIHGLGYKFGGDEN